MEFTKPQVSNKDVQDIVRLYPFGEMEDCIDLGGIPNTTCKVRTSSGKTFAVRISNHGQTTREHIELEIDVLQHLALEKFPCPRVIHGTNMEILQKWQGYYVCATDFIPGNTADKMLISKKLTKQVGQLVAQLQYSLRDFNCFHRAYAENFFERGDAVLTDIDKHINARGLRISSDFILTQWKKAKNTISLLNGIEQGIIHADIWPPNLICNGDIVTLVDFDDCCQGPTYFDLALALMECSMFMSVNICDDLAAEFLYGFLTNGGKILCDADLLIHAMQAACAMWFAYELVEAPTFTEGEIYLERLSLFADSYSHNQIVKKLENLIRFAQSKIQL